MQFKLFSIPATGDAEAEEELNRFLRSHRVVSVEKELVQGGHTAYWCFCVEYLLNGPLLQLSHQLNRFLGFPSKDRILGCCEGLRLCPNWGNSNCRFLDQFV
jgi:hypothetical protein